MNCAGPVSGFVAGPIVSCRVYRIVRMLNDGPAGSGAGVDAEEDG